MFTRPRLLALLALLFVTPALALAQVISVPRIQVQPVQSAPTAQQDLNVDPAMDPERARQTIAKLRAEKRELDGKLTAALATIDEMTKRGGSLVRAYCDGSVSRTTAGAEENCAASGYACAPVEGTCRRSCNVTTDCAAYHVCDTAAHVCVRV